MKSLNKEEMNEITEHFEVYIKENISKWLTDLSFAKPVQVYEIELRERMIRLEEELKHQRELMKQGFDQMDKRFEQVDKRFEQVDDRFESMQQQSDKRFESMDKRFDALTKRIDRFMIWSFGLTITMSGVIITVLKLWK